MTKTNFMIKVSPSGRWLCLSGPNGLTIVDLPKRLGRQGRFVGSEGGEKELLCRSYPIAQRFFMGQPKVVVQKVWCRFGFESFKNHFSNKNL